MWGTFPSKRSLRKHCMQWLKNQFYGWDKTQYPKQWYSCQIDSEWKLSELHGTQMSEILSNSSSCPRKPNTVAQVFLTETSKFNALDTKCTGNSQTIETVCAGTLSNSSSWPRKTNRVVQVFQTCDFNASDINVRDIVKLADLHSQKVTESQARNVNVPDTDMQCLQWTQSNSKIVTYGC